jgi:hypothetical protein
MWDFIVLGNIPGTSIYVTFVTWLYIVGIIAWAAILIWCVSKRTLFASWRIALIIGQEIKDNGNSLGIVVGRHNTLPVQLQLFQ